MVYRDDCEFYGRDFSIELVKICKSKNLNVVSGNVLNIPYKNDMFDNTLCIAVIHHLSDIEKEKNLLKNY